MTADQLHRLWENLPQPTLQAVDSLHNNPDNPRTITEANFEALKTKIESQPIFLKFKPLQIDSTGMVHSGNQRLKAVRELGWTHVPAINIEELTETERKDLALIDNISYGAWDEVRLMAQWSHEQLTGAGFPIDTSSNWIKLNEPDQDPEEIQDDNFDLSGSLSQQTDIKPGDLFQIGPHRLLCGDATSAKAWNKLMNHAQANCLITDPPYNVDYEGTDGMKIMNDHMGDGAFYKFLFDSFINCLVHTKEGGGAYIFHADSEGRNFRNAYEDSGFLLKQCLIWVKNAFTIGRQDYQWKHEPILYGWKPGAGHYFTHHRDQGTVFGESRPSAKITKAKLLEIVDRMHQEYETTVLEYNKPKRNALHPTMKPLPLLAHLVRNSTKPGELIIDPFLGSGSTMLAGHQMNRYTYGMDLDPNYCQAVLDRMEEADPSLEIKRIKG